MFHAAHMVYRNTRAISEMILAASYIIVGVIALLLVISFLLGHAFALGRLSVCGGALLYIGIAHSLLHKSHEIAGAYMLTLFYFLLASGIVYTWGINTPVGVLLFGIVIVLAGILLSARHALLGAGLSILVIFVAHARIPWASPYARESSLADVIAFTVVFSMLALISWLYNNEVERSLSRALHAEALVRKQKANLEIAVQQRTAELRQAQLEEMQQMYRFSEIGQLGVNLLHDLANHLTTLTLAVEELPNRSKDMAHIREVMHYLEEMVANTRDRLYGTARPEEFDLIQSVSNAVTFLQYKASQAHVDLQWQAPAEQWQHEGDAISLCQALLIIINNSIEAYATTKNNAKPHVTITATRTKKHMIVTVEDWGKGIPKATRRELFKPFRSTKKTGLGVGLFLARQTIITSFGGTLSIDPNTTHTKFILRIPHG